MMHRSTGMVGIAAVAFASLTAFAAARQTPTAEVMSLGLRGVYFVENQGQWSDASVEYGFKTRGLDIAFRESSFTMHLARESSQASPTRERGIPDEGAWASRPYEAGAWASPPYERSIAPEASPTRERGVPFPDDADPLPHGRGSSSEAVDYEHLTLTVTFPGSNPATPRGAQAQAAKFNYYIGDDESRWASNVPSFAAIIYENLYDGVDLLICGNDDGVLKYEFHVAPGADWNQIRIAYDGIDSLCVDDSGDLRIKTTFGTLMDSAPMVWQEDADFTPSPGSAGEGRGGGDLTSRSTIPARFELVNATTYRFALDGPVDPSRTLIIDPDVEWMVYLGGRGYDYGRCVAADGDGGSLLVGVTQSQDFIGRSNSYIGGLSDAFLVKVSASGEVAWMTYLGGADSEDAEDVATDGTGSIYVTGPTESEDFGGRINTLSGGADAFLVKVSASGSLIWMAYVGGSYIEYGYGVDADDRGALVTGWTNSLDCPGRTNVHHGGIYDGFVTRVGEAGSIEWTTYLGGQYQDHARAVAVTNEYGAVVTGWTNSPDFEGRRNEYHGGSEDTFLVRVDLNGAIEWMTYLGGSRTERGSDVTLDSTGDILVTGNTTSDDVEGRNNTYASGPDAFVLKSTPSGGLQWMTYLGGTGGDYGHAIAIDHSDSNLIAGQTSSADFDGRANTFQGGVNDAFVLTLDAQGQERTMIYLGGSRDDWGNGVAIGLEGYPVVSGATESRDFFLHRNSFYGGLGDAFLVQVSLEGVSLSASASCPSGGRIEVDWRGAIPNGSVVLIFARSSGSFAIPTDRRCPGVQLGLGSTGIRVAFQGLSGPDGSRTLNANAGPDACGGYLQLLDLTTCSTSNVVRIE